MGVDAATGVNSGAPSQVHTPAPERVADNTKTKPADSPKTPTRPGASGNDTAPGIVVTETKRTAQAAIAYRASAASDTASTAVSAYQAERDHPATSGEEHKHLLADLKEFAVAATKLDRQLHTMNTKACLREVVAAKAARAELERNGASPDELFRAEGRVSTAGLAHTQSKAAQANAEKLSNVDTAVVPGTKTTAQASIADRAGDASDTAFKAVSAYQGERAYSATSGEERKQLLADLKEFAVVATKLDRQLQTINTKACLREETAAKAKLAGLKKDASPDELIQAHGRVSRAVLARKQSMEAQANAGKLSNVDTVDLIDYLAPEATSAVKAHQKDRDGSVNPFDSPKNSTIKPDRPETKDRDSSVNPF